MALGFFCTIAILLILSTAHCSNLPTYFSPSSYDLSLTLPENIFTTENGTAYTGSVIATFTVSSESVSEIVLYASATYLNVTSVSLTSDSVAYGVTDWSVNSTTDILNITLESSLDISLTYVLTLIFDGNVSTSDMYGIYKSSYTDSSNNTYYLATTQMGPTYARRVFPCFDEPSYKTNFTISLTYPTGLNVLANTDVSSTSSSATDVTTAVFNSTPKMSTYLVGFTVSNFTCTEGTLMEGVLPCQVCSRNESSSTRSWALEVAPKVVDCLNSYTSVNYSTYMTKLDQVAITDLSTGSLDNWGLITGRERELLYDDDETSSLNKQYITQAITKELAYQWFGNLVTCKWWSTVFLNSGLANYFEFFATHELFPEYEMDKQFIVKVLQGILETDASSSEALISDVSTSSEISAKFDGISYYKGGSIFRMVKNILGTTAWKTGLNTYLNEFALSSVEPDDLWEVLNASASSANLPVANLSIIMDNWINYPGYPVLTVSTSDGTLKISQERFVYNNKTSSNVTWYVPITLSTSLNTLVFDETEPVAWLTPTADVEVALGGTLSWIIINNQQTGYYRVNYDDDLWSGLATALQETNFSSIPEIHRAQIADDVLNLARGGYVNYSQAFTVTQFLANETSYVSWYAAFRGFDYILKRFGASSTLGNAISSNILTLCSSLIASVPLSTMNDSDHIYTLKQELAQTWACKLGNSDCISYAVENFAIYKNSSVRPNKNLRTLVYSYGLKHSTDISVDWEFLWNTYLSTSLASEQITVIEALGSTSNETILKSYLQKTLTDDSGIRSQDYTSVFSAVCTGSSVGVTVALDFFIEYYSDIVARYTSMNGVRNILLGIAKEITTVIQITKLQNFIANGTITGTLLEVANEALLIAESNYEWLETYKGELYSYYGISEETTESPSTTTDSSDDSEEESYRLPTYCTPSNYDVTLNLPENIFTTENVTAYTGTVAITFTASSANVKKVVLHASATYLNITAITLVSETVTYSVTSWSVNTTTDILTVTLGSSLDVSLTYVLTLTFEGQLSNTDTYGFYKSSYTDSSSTTYHLAVTQMESIYARRVFPCFDEPSYKATFNISLTYPSGLNVMANTDVNSTSTTDNLTTAIFNPTPKMSTYSVAFIVSNFTCSEGNLLEGTLSYQVCSRNETSSTRSWALEVGPKVVDCLNSYTGVNYSTYMTKLDIVARIDLSATGGENWGLNTYREERLLYDEDETSNLYKQQIASAIAKKVAYQWFGNLVTCKWWSEVFLNNGFAAYLEFFIIQELYPDYEMDKQFVIKSLQEVLEIDASSSETLNSDVSTTSEIFDKFNSLSYYKAGSIFRMVENILGTTSWKTGLNAYLNEFALSSVESDDLWTVLNSSATSAYLPESNLSVIVKNWINCPGYPVINVTITNSTLKISQQRFVYNNKTSSNVTWYVPITLATSLNTLIFDETTPVAWLTPEADLEVALGGTLTWIIINNQQTGYYRVNYDDDLWASLATALQQTNFSSIPEINRAQIADDALNLARGGYITYSQAFTITQFLSNETSYTTWYAGFRGFGYILKRVNVDAKLETAISNHILTLCSSLIASVPLTTINDSNHIYTLNQELAQSWACKLGNDNCISYAVEHFSTYRNTSVRPNKNLRSLVYRYGLKHSTDISSDWEFLWNAFLSTSVSSERSTIIEALGSTTNETILRAYLQKTLTDDSGIISQDYSSVFSAVYTGSSVGVTVALDFFIEYYSDIIVRYTSTNEVGKILKGIAEQISSETDITKLQNFIASGASTGILLKVANDALVIAQSNYEWLETYKEVLYSYYGISEETTAATTTAATTTTEKTAVTHYLEITFTIFGKLIFRF